MRDGLSNVLDRGGGEQEVVGQSSNSQQDVLGNAIKKMEKTCHMGLDMVFLSKGPAVVFLSWLEHSPPVSVVVSQTGGPKDRQDRHECQSRLDLIPDACMFDTAKEGKAWRAGR